jgi:CobQ-like glutamine amidotransferase family enzyme
MPAGSWTVSHRTELCVVALYPDLLGTYGDRGNALALGYRIRARGMRMRLVEVAPGEKAPRSGDIYLIGGGEDAAQLLALQALRADADLEAALGGEAAWLAVCAGLQLLSVSFSDRSGHRVSGLGVLDVRCGRLDGPRAVGEVIADPVGIASLPTLTGFENHQGTAVLGQRAQPLGRVRRGVGNGDGATEGVVQGNVVATYLHGPVLVRNPSLADYLIERSTGPLPPFQDPAVERLRCQRIDAALGHSRNRRTASRPRRLLSSRRHWLAGPR